MTDVAGRRGPSAVESARVLGYALPVTARQILLQQIADLSEDDAHALLPIVQRLRAKRVAPGSPQAATVDLT